MHIDPQLKKNIKHYILQKLQESDMRQIVTIVSPYTLDQQEIAQLKHKIPALAHASLLFEVDQSLLAGIIIRCGSRMLDFSLKSELQTLQHTLYESA